MNITAKKAIQLAVYWYQVSHVCKPTKFSKRGWYFDGITHMYIHKITKWRSYTWCGSGT